MISILNRHIRTLMGLLFILVISLCCNVIAAKAMDVATLAPIVEGINTPLKLAIDTNGDIYVADPRSGGVVIVNQYGKLVKVLPTARTISAVALLNNSNSINGGKMVVALGDRVAVLDREGTELALLGSGAGQFAKTSGIAVDSDGKIYVVDAGAYQIKVFNSNGAYSFSFGSYGTGDSQFLLPDGIGVFTEPAGIRIAVTDVMNGKVIIYNSAGLFQRKIGTNGAPTATVGPLYFYYPSGVAFEYKNNALFRIYILDMYLGQIQAVDAVSGNFIGYIGSLGNDAGKLVTPSDVIFDQVNKRLLVANGWSNLVSFGIDGGQNPVNAVPPNLIINNPSTTVNTPSIVLTGSVDAGCTITASVNTPARAGAAGFSSTTAWLIPVNGLIPGSNKISVIAKNSYGISITKTVDIRYAPPTAVLSINSLPSLTSQSTTVLSGTTEPGSYVYINNANNRFSGQADVDSGGSWTFNLSLTEGVNNIDVSASRSGATAAFKTITVILDTTAPALTVSAMVDGGSSATPIQNISGTAIDPNLASVTVNGIQVPVTSGAFSYAVTLVKGPNLITVSAIDSLGNTRTNSRTINFDPALPIISVATPADGAYTNLGDIAVSGSVNQAASVTVNGVPANPSGGLEWNATIRLAIGINTIEIAAIDQYGSVAVQKRTILYDKVAPDLAITSPSQDLAVKSPGMTIKGMVGDNTGINAIKATINGVDRQVTLENGEFSIFADFTVEGPNTIAVSVTDLAGNTTTAIRTIVYDITPPLLTVDPVAAGYPAQFSGSLESGASLVIKDANGLSGRITVNGEKWIADFTGVTYDPATLVAQATDAAGNISINRIRIPVISGGDTSEPEIIYGDMDGDGVVTMADALIILRLVVLNEAPGQKKLVHGDIGPLLNGKVNPKGKLDIVDVVLILRKAMGLSSWNQ